MRRPNMFASGNSAILCANNFSDICESLKELSSTNAENDQQPPETEGGGGDGASIAEQFRGRTRRKESARTQKKRNAYRFLGLNCPQTPGYYTFRMCLLFIANFFHL